RFHHDNANSGDHERDAILPGKPMGASLTGSQIKLTAPGDDLLCGTAASYEMVTANHPLDESNFDTGTPLAGAPAPEAAGTEQTFEVPAGAERYVAIRAVDDQGNVGRSVTLDRGPGSGGGGGGGGGNGGGSGATAGQVGGTLGLTVKPRRASVGRRTCFTSSV